jgi:hypothetical protein
MQKEKSSFKLRDVKNQTDSKGKPLQMTNERLDKAKKILSIANDDEEIKENQVGDKIKEKISEFNSTVDKSNSESMSTWRDELMVLIELYHRVKSSNELNAEFLKQLSGQEKCDAYEFLGNINPIMQELGLSNIAIGNFTKQGDGTVVITNSLYDVTDLGQLDVVKIARPEPQFPSLAWLKYKIFGDSASERNVDIRSQIPESKKISSFSVYESGLFGLYSHYVTYTEENGKYYKVDTMPLIGGKSEISKEEFDEKMGRASIVQFVSKEKQCSGCDALFKNDGNECYMNTVLTMLLNSDSINSEVNKKSQSDKKKIMPEQVQNKELWQQGQQEITTACCREKINPQSTRHCYDCCKNQNSEKTYNNETCYKKVHAYNVSKQGDGLLGSMFDGTKAIDGIPVNYAIGI